MPLRQGQNPRRVHSPHIHAPVEPGQLHLRPYLIKLLIFPNRKRQVYPQDQIKGHLPIRSQELSEFWKRGIQDLQQGQ